MTTLSTICVALIGHADKEIKGLPVGSGKAAQRKRQLEREVELLENIGRVLAARGLVLFYQAHFKKVAKIGSEEGAVIAFLVKDAGEVHSLICAFRTGEGRIEVRLVHLPSAISPEGMLGVNVLWAQGRPTHLAVMFYDRENDLILEVE